MKKRGFIKYRQIQALKIKSKQILIKISGLRIKGVFNINEKQDKGTNLCVP